MKNIEQIEQLLRVREVAQILGVSRSKVYALVEEGSLPVVRMGGSVRISQSALSEFVAASQLDDGDEPEGGG